MKTVIFKWNPAFSSYNMHHYLSDLIDMVTEYEPDYNWSVWDWKQIHEGDRFFWVKVGMYGQTGIVASGKSLQSRTKMKTGLAKEEKLIMWISFRM